MPCLELRGVQKRFGNHEAVADLSFQLRPGDFLGLIGPNGAGKTTTLRMICGHLQPTGGEIRLQGRDATLVPLEVRRAIGYVPEFLALYDYLTGEEFVGFMGEARGLTSTACASERDLLLEMLELGDERGRLIRTYSQGMRRKVALAGALIGRPPILVLDESLNGLDPATNHRLKQHLLELTRQGTAIILSSHILEVLERLCTRVLVVVSGRLVEALEGSSLEKVRTQAGGLEAYFMKILAENRNSAQ